MNLLLFDPGELEDSGEATLTGRRAQHLRKVLRVAVGDTIRAGVLNGRVGDAEILSIDREHATLRFTERGCAPAPGSDVLILGVARPKVLLRCLEHAAAIGFGRIALLRTNRVDKNHLLASALDEAVLTQRLRLGLEQARRTALPRLTVHRRFRAFAEEEVEEVATPLNRFVAHQDAESSALSAKLAPESLSIVIGPEGGLLDFEVDALVQRGFQSLNFGSAPLRVETALSFVTGHLTAQRTAITAITAAAVNAPVRELPAVQ